MRFPHQKRDDMTFREKTIAATALTIITPIVVVLLMWFGYNGDVISLGKLDTTSLDGVSLSRTQEVLNLYELATSDIEWGAIHEQQDGEGDLTYTSTPADATMKELTDLGFRITVEQDGEVIFSNFQEGDTLLIGSLLKKNASKSCVMGTQSCTVIRDELLQNDSHYEITALFDVDGVESKTLASVSPVYLVTPSMLLLFLAGALATVMVVSLATLRWLGNSVEKPLGALALGSHVVAGGDFGHRIDYDRNDEFGKVCDDFNEMAAKLEGLEEERKRNEQQRKSFLSDISHDLRSPLTSIRGYAEGLRDGVADTEEKRQRYYGAIITRALDLEHLTDSLGELVRVEQESYRFRLQPTGLCGFLEDLVSDRHAFLQESCVDIRFERPAQEITVLAEEKELRRVFFNLLDNTIKYRVADSSKVELSVVRTEDGDSVQVRYCDDGPGVQEKYLERLFDSFFRTDESRTDPGSGSGLGLAVVKRVVEGHGGTVRAYLDGGLGMLITLPIYESEGEKAS